MYDDGFHDRAVLRLSSFPQPVRRTLECSQSSEIIQTDSTHAVAVAPADLGTATQSRAPAQARMCALACANARS